MKNLKEYILESKEVYYVLFLENLEDMESLNELEEIKPIYTLKSSDYDAEEDEIKVKGKSEFYASENTNYSYDNTNNTTPIAGDLVFEISGNYILYRKGLGGPTAEVDSNALIGTIDDLVSYLKEFSKEMKSDYNCDIEKLLK
jgi:hypothetical protein